MISPSRIRITRLACVGHLLLVGDDHDGPAFGVELVEQRQHLGRGPRVERAGRLVGQQQHRLGHDRPGDRDPLLLPAGELVGQVAGAVGQADRVERGQRPPAPLGRADLGVAQRQRDVVDRAGARRSG